MNKINASKFSSIFKGNLSKLSPKSRGFVNKTIINDGAINSFNSKISGGGILLQAKIFHSDKH